MKFIIFFLCIIPASILANDCGNSDCQCWAPCFKECQSRGLAKEYALIYKTIQTVRGAVNAYNVHETTFAFDGTASNSILRQVQRNLASILAITIPAGTDCNSFYAAQYFRNFAYSFGSWQCRRKCDIARFLQGFGYRTQTSTYSSGDWVGGACLLGNYYNARGLCNKPGGRMVVTFENSKVRREFLSECFRYDVGVAVKLSGDPLSSTILPQKQAVTSNADLFEIDLYGRAEKLLEATINVLRCVTTYCCSDCQYNGRKKRSLLEVFEDRAIDDTSLDYTSPELGEDIQRGDVRELEELFQKFEGKEGGVFVEATKVEATKVK